MGAANADELATLVAELDRERQEWIDALLVQDDGMTILGPFGSEAVRPSPMQAKVAALFRGGTGSVEIVQAIADAGRG